MENESENERFPICLVYGLQNGHHVKDITNTNAILRFYAL